MYSPLELDPLYRHHQRKLLHEAQQERLARLVPHRRAGVRPWLAAALHALADRLDCQCPVPHPAASAYGRASSS
jgi:hypothetical protein